MISFNYSNRGWFSQCSVRPWSVRCDRGCNRGKKECEISQLSVLLNALMHGMVHAQMVSYMDDIWVFPLDLQEWLDNSCAPVLGLCSMYLDDPKSSCNDKHYVKLEALIRAVVQIGRWTTLSTFQTESVYAKMVQVTSQHAGQTILVLRGMARQKSRCLSFSSMVGQTVPVCKSMVGQVAPILGPWAPTSLIIPLVILS